jgi:hypothetical protein
VPPVCVDDVITHDLAQPEMKGQPGVPQILTQPLAGLEQHVLYNIAGIDPPSDRLV